MTERDCCPRCGAKVTVKGGVPDFRRDLRGVTFYHWCRECKRACDPVRCKRGT